MGKMAVYRGYRRSVNMSYGQLKTWSKTPCSKKASLDRSPISRNLRLLGKPVSQWDSKDVRDAKRTISFNARMRAVKAGKREGDCPSKRTIALRNWAYNPS